LNPNQAVLDWWLSNRTRIRIQVEKKSILSNMQRPQCPSDSWFLPADHFNYIGSQAFRVLWMLHFLIICILIVRQGVSCEPCGGVIHVMFITAFLWGTVNAGTKYIWGSTDITFM
jgi:hypothetical protein